MIKFRVYGYPRAQGRPRFARVGKFVKTYDPKESKDWKDSVRTQAILNRVVMLQGPLRMALTFYLPRPKTLPKKVLHHVKKPDASNLLKGVEDALKGITYADDSQIVTLIIKKEYHPEPGVLIIIDEIKEVDN